MGAKKPKWRKGGLPEWLVINRKSSYAPLPADLLQSKQFQELSRPAANLYLVLLAHARTRENCECLYNAIRECDAFLGLHTPNTDIMDAIYASDFRFFTFPAKHAEKYGFSPALAWKYRQELLSKGFIHCLVRRKHAKRVSIYCFSSRWQNPTWKHQKHPTRQGDFIEPFWNGFWYEKQFDNDTKDSSSAKRNG